MTFVLPTRQSFAARVTSADPVRSSDSDRIRGRLLYRLGIYDPNFTNASIYHGIHRESRKNQRREKQGVERGVLQPPLPRQGEPRDIWRLDMGRPARHLVPLDFVQEHPHSLISSNVAPSSSPSGVDGLKGTPPARIAEMKPCQERLYLHARSATNYQGGAGAQRRVEYTRIQLGEIAHDGHYRGEQDMRLGDYREVCLSGSLRCQDKKTLPNLGATKCTVYALRI